MGVLVRAIEATGELNFEAQTVMSSDVTPQRGEGNPSS